MPKRNGFCATLRAILAPVVVVTACAAMPPPRAVPDPVARDQRVLIPVTDANGQVETIQARLCRPASDAPARLIVLNHGAPSDRAMLSRIGFGNCNREAARWFLDRGYVLLFPLRRGYGANGGEWAEDFGPCEQADYLHSGLETARDIAAAVEYATALPFVKPSGVIVLGHSAGGWGAMAYDSLPHPQVAAFISMAGGRGGRSGGVDDQVCHEDRLLRTAAHFGETARSPMLWIYAANDQFFGPATAEALHTAFVGAGGSAQLVEVGPYDHNGHALMFGKGGPDIWGPPMDAFLAAYPK